MVTLLPGPIVSPAWLAEHLHRPDLVVLDASWYLPAMNRDPRQEFLDAHIPGAAFFDLDALSEPATTLPHMFPDEPTVGRQLGELGVSNRDAVVVYDGSGTNLSAPRAWWHLRAHGHDKVAVLDGGLGRWRAEGRPVESGPATRPPAEFRAERVPGAVWDLAMVRAAVGDPSVQLLDARSRGRFEGTEPEPRPGLRGGHVPGARNIPFTDLVAADGTLKSLAELTDLFRAAGIDLDRPVVTSCGSGVTACALLLALEAVGHREHAVYDGAWTEWGGRADTPVATGPA
ncbi:MAG: 3-mercaptopyruvate sulfurtransferase [Gemmatimonadales bacterium]